MILSSLWSISHHLEHYENICLQNSKFQVPLEFCVVNAWSDLDQLPRYYSRSPYGNETKTLVFLRSDVEQM